MMPTLVQRLVLLSIAVLIAACGSVNVDEVLPDKAVEYKRERQAERNLEIPPDLTSDRINDKMSVPDNFGGVATSYSEFVTDRRLKNAGGGGQGVGQPAEPAGRPAQRPRSGTSRCGATAMFAGCL